MCTGRRGMTLIEIMVVIAILGIISVAIGVSVVAWLAEAKRKSAKIQVDSVSTAVTIYAVQRELPASLNEVVDAGLLRPAKLRDPWRQPLLYGAPSQRPHYMFDVCSSGDDRAPGGDDDICN